MPLTQACAAVRRSKQRDPHASCVRSFVRQYEASVPIIHHVHEVTAAYAAAAIGGLGSASFEVEPPAASRAGPSVPLTIRTGLARRLHRLEFAARSAAHGP